jgi:hypothetical protein
MTLLIVDSDQEVPHYWIGANRYAVCGSDKLLHRMLMTQWLGRELLPTEHVHHINRNKLDNRKENLYLCRNGKEHKELHAREDCERAGYDPNLYRWCSYHQRYELREGFGKHAARCLAGTNEFRKGKGYKTVFDWKAVMNQQCRRAVKRESPVPLRRADVHE